jgi:uncharacterized membrane protein
MFSDAARTANQRYARLEAIVSQLSNRVQALEERTARAKTADVAPIAEYRETPSSAPMSEVGEAPPSLSSDLATPAVEIAAAAQTDELSSAREFEAETQPDPHGSRIDSLPRGFSPDRKTLWKFLLGGNTLVRVGVIVLFFGVAFLLKFASEHIEIPIEARLIGVALGALVMLAIGWRLRLSRPGYGLILQGGAIGVLYLTVFAAFRLYQLLPGAFVLALLAAMAVFSAMLAVMQDSRSLAAMGVSGGFLAPILASTGGGSHIMLFSFYALLNFGILVIAWYKAWRVLNLLGFAFTFVIGLLWGARYYHPELFPSTEPFLILFFLFYVAIAVLFALRQDATITSRVDGTLVFGTPLIAFGLQTALVRDFEYGAAFSALTLGACYLLLAKFLFARARDNVRLLCEAFIALGVVFATLAIPLALDGRWTAAAWALEGAAIVWAGVRQEKLLARGFGIFLQFAAGAAFWLDAPYVQAPLPIFNSLYLGCVLLSVSGLFSAWYVRRQAARVTEPERSLAILLFVWGAAWWCAGAFNEIHEHVARDYRLHAALLFLAASCVSFSLLHRRIDWREAKYAALALLPLMVICALLEVDRVTHPFAYFGFLVWPLAFAAHLWLLRRHEDTPRIDWRHAAGVWLFAALGAWELAWQIGELFNGGDTWRLIGWPLLPLVLLAWWSDRGERIGWPVARHLNAYLFYGALPLAGFLWLWLIYANFASRGDAPPLPYLPLLNPLDLVQCAALIALWAWSRRIRSATVVPKTLQSGELSYSAIGGAGFIWLNGMLLRTLHHWAGVPFQFDEMMRSMIVQASFSIFWSLLALCTMLIATRRQMRPLWLTGAGLMALVVVKLFFVDLSNVGGIERIVSFMGVGVLMLVIGYISPVPPASAQEGK